MRNANKIIFFTVASLCSGQILISLVIFGTISPCAAVLTCSVRKHYVKTYYSIENGIETTTAIKLHTLTENHNSFDGTCFTIVSSTNLTVDKLDSMTVVYKNQYGIVNILHLL